MPAGSPLHHCVDPPRHIERPLCWACRAARPGMGSQHYLFSCLLCTLVVLGSIVGAHGSKYFIAPPSWTKTENWRPAAAPGSQYYWHDTSFAPSCPWDIGRLLNEALFVPVRFHRPCSFVLTKGTALFWRTSRANPAAQQNPFNGRMLLLLFSYALFPVERTIPGLAMALNSSLD